MAIRDLAGMILDCRLHAQDDNTAGNGLTDPNWTTLLNEIIQAYASAFPEHFTINQEAWAPTFTSGVATWTSATTATYNVRRLLKIFHSTSRNALERYEPYRLEDMLARDSAAGTPTRCAFRQDNESATMSDKPNSFTVWVWPPPAGAQTMYVSYEFYPKDLSSATDLPRGFGDADSRWITLLASARGAFLNGKSREFCDEILRGVPEEIATRIHVREGLLAPRIRPQEAAL